MSDLNLKLEKMDYHRNGICGESFYVVLFNDLDNKCKMVATVFTSSIANPKENPYCAVYDIAKLCEGDVEFGQGNSWRGDRYFCALLPQMKAYWQETKGYELTD